MDNPLVLENIKKYKLDNGLFVVVIPKKNIPIITLQISFKVGSKNESPNRTGMAHLFEHLMFEGTKNIGKGEFDRFCSLAGGTNNAYTTNDYTSYYMTLPSNQLELGLWLESDRMKNFHVTKEALENQKKVVIEEIKQTVDEQPYGKWHENLSTAAFAKDYCYSWEVYGTKEHVEKVSLEEAEEFHKRFYSPDNACLVISGNVGKNVLEMVNKNFGIIKSYNNHTGDKIFKNSVIKGGKRLILRDNVPLPAVFLAFHCNGFIQEQIFTAEILANILGSGKSSRIYESLIQKKQSASQAGAWLDQKENNSFLICYAFASNPSITCNMLYDDIINETEKIKSDILSGKELRKVKNRIISQLYAEMQFSQGISDIAAFQALFWAEPERLNELAVYYEKTELKDIQNLCKNILNYENSVRIDVIPK